MFGVDAKDFVSNVDRFLSIGSKKGEISVVFRVDYGETHSVSRTVGAGAKWLLGKEIGGSFEVEDHARIEVTEARMAKILVIANGRPLAELFKLVIGPFQNDFLGLFVIKQPTKHQEAFYEILG
jgi:exonuclease SbcC